jgi:cytochrome P450
MHVIDLDSGPLATHWRENTVGTLYEIAKRAPGQALGMQIGTERLLLLQDATQIRHVLREVGAKYRKNFGGFVGFFGESRLTADGERWEYLQTLSQRHIAAARPGDVTRAAAAAFAVAADEILATRDADGGVVVDASLNRAAAQVISDVALGNHGVDVDKVLDDFREVLRFGSRRNWSVGGAMVAETAEDRASYQTAKDRIVTAIRRALASEQRSQLLRDIEAGEANGADPVGEISTLLFAGFDTTAAALSWALFLLATVPDLQASLRDKLRDAIGDAPPTLERLEAIPDLQFFQNEVLRIFPPVPMLGRIALAPDKVDGVEIAEGQRLVISIIGMHHDARRFPAPTQIRLRRYQEDPPQGSHMAFGAGRRGCAGSRIANVEMAIALAVLISRLEFGLADQSRIGFDFVASMRRLGGQRLLVREAAR